MRAQKISKRAAKYNLDFLNDDDCFQKIYEELNELNAAVKGGDGEKIKSEGGDALFALASYLQKIGVDGETALNETVNKFINRFSRAEKLAKKDGVDFKNLPPDEVDKYYASAKADENGN